MYDEAFLAKIIPVLREYFDPLASIWSNRFYYIVPPTEAQFPCGVWQSQDSGGKADDTIGANGWEGLITFRSIARSLSESEDKLLALAQTLPFLTHLDFDISMRINRPLTLPIEEDSVSKIYTSAIIVRTNIHTK